MRKTEVFITFYLLQDKTNLSKNIRQMAADLGLSIGSVHNALQQAAFQTVDVLINRLYGTVNNSKGSVKNDK